MPELHDFEIFMTTARCASFTEAAGKLRLSVATISRAIQRLEQQLDCRLFNRTTRRLNLTADGRMALEEVSAGINHLRNIRLRLQEQHQSASGTVRVLLPNGFAKYYMMPALPSFLEQYPKIDLDMYIEDFRTDLLAGGFDVAVQHGPIPDSGYISRSIGEMNVVLVASPAYLARHGVPATGQDLKSHHCLQSRRDKGGPTFIWNLHSRSTGENVIHHPRGRIFVNNQLDATIHAALSGMGITPSDIRAVHNHLCSGELKVVLPDFSLVTSSAVHMLYPHRDHVPLGARVFMDFIADGARDWLDIADFDPHDFAA